MEFEHILYEKTRYSTQDFAKTYVTLNRLPQILHLTRMIFSPDGSWKIVVDRYGNSYYALLIAPIINQLLSLQLLQQEETSTYRVIHMSHAIAGGVLPIVDWIDCKELENAVDIFQSQFLAYCGREWIFRGFPNGAEDLSKRNSWSVCGFGKPFISVADRFATYVILCFILLFSLDCIFKQKLTFPQTFHTPSPTPQKSYEILRNKVFLTQLYFV